MLRKSGLSINEAFEKACIDNDIIYHKSDCNTEVDPITLVDREGNSFMLSQGLEVINLPDDNVNVNMQSIRKFHTAFKKQRHGLKDVKPFNVKSKDGTDIAVVALGPQYNNRIHNNYSVGEAVYAVPYFALGGDEAVEVTKYCVSENGTIDSEPKNIQEAMPPMNKGHVKNKSNIQQKNQSKKK